MPEENLYFDNQWRKIANFSIFNKIKTYLRKNIVHLKYQPREKVHILVISREVNRVATIRDEKS